MCKLQAVILDHEVSPVLAIPGLPSILPLGHITDSALFPAVVDNWELRPMFCNIHGKDLVFFYYGGLFFRRGMNPTRKASMYPVGMLFGSSVLRIISNYYPFDTGAIGRGFYGEGEIKNSWIDCCMKGGDPETPAQLVRYLFGNNSNYFHGRVSMLCRSLPEPFPWLLEFLRRVRIDRGSDQRQYRIEGQSQNAVSLDDVIWVGYPDIYTAAFARLYEKRSKVARENLGVCGVPERYSYNTYSAARPSEMAAVLQQQAVNFLREYFGERI